MEIAYQPYIDPDYESLIERIHPARVCIDNESYRECTLVKVDSANKQGILLEMVQVLTDLDLVISKSYISSDGGWLMDVFHVTDQFGNKLTDESLMLYIQQALCSTKEGGLSKELNLPRKKDFKSRHMSAEHTALEVTAVNRAGVLSEISAALAELACHIATAVVWTHKKRAAFIVYVEDDTKGGPITDPKRLAQIEAQVENVVEAHHMAGEQHSVRLTAPTAGRTHTERRLHQLMFADRDYEQCCGGCPCGKSWRDGGGGGGGDGCCTGVHVSIEGWKGKGYSVVNIQSKDRPKLLFDTVCALTELEYVVFHAAVSSVGSTANQEYFIRHKDGHTLDENEKLKLAQCLVAAIERRVTQGLRLEVRTQNRSGLLSTMTRVFRENGLSITSAEIGTRGERAIGSFYVTDASGQDVNPNVIESIRKEIKGSLIVVNSGKSSGWNSPQSSSSSSVSRSGSGNSIDEKPRLSLGSIIWSHIERFSGNFGPIKL